MTLPAVSLELLAESWVVASPGTAAVRPALASWPGVPVAAGGPEQLELVNRLHRGGAAAGAALDLGVVVVGGESGSVSVREGAAGAVESSV